MQPIRIAIMDVSDLSRYGLQALVQKLVPDVKLVGTFSNLSALEDLLDQSEVDVLLLDDMLPQTLYIGSAINHLHTLRPAMNILVISHKLNVSYIQDIFRHCVSGYIYKEERLNDILAHAFQIVRQGKVYMSPQVSVLPYTSPLATPNAKLSTRDLNVLHLMHAGKSVQEMSIRLEVSNRVIYDCQKKLRQALGVPTTELIVAAAVKKEWLPNIETA